MNTINRRIEELMEQGMSTAKVKAFLTLEDYSAKDIAAAMKEMGATSKPKTFASDYYDWLASSKRTAEQAVAYIQGTGEFGETSKNVKAHQSHYLNIWSLSAAIWVKQDTKVEDTDEEIEIKAAWVFHKKMTAKLDSRKSLTKAEKSKCHPDKVAQYNDKELTAAYNELSKRAA